MNKTVRFYLVIVILLLAIVAVVCACKALYPDVPEGPEPMPIETFAPDEPVTLPAPEEEIVPGKAEDIPALYGEAPQEPRNLEQAPPEPPARAVRY